jgi:hypothetical protein
VLALERGHLPAADVLALERGHLPVDERERDVVAAAPLAVPVMP